MIRTINLHTAIEKKCSPEQFYQLNLSKNGESISKRLPPIDFFLICDSYEDSEIANFVTLKLKQLFLKLNLQYPLNHNHICKINEYMQKKLKKYTQQNELKNGCTASVVIRYVDYNQERIQVINFGNCKTILSRKEPKFYLPINNGFLSNEKQTIEFVNKKNGSIFLKNFVF